MTLEIGFAGLRSGFNPHIGTPLL